MKTAARLSTICATLLCLGTALAQGPPTSSTGLDTHRITPEDVLTIREVRELQISPDGKQVAFTVREPADPKVPRARRTSNIWIVGTDGRESAHPLIPNLKNGASPRWSPDGQWLAFLSDRGESGVDNPEATTPVSYTHLRAHETPEH